MRQLARYGTVGVSNTLLSAGVYALLVGAGMSAVEAASLAFAVGALNGFLWNRRWTFASSARASLALYLVVQGAGLAATDLLVWLLARDAGRLAAYAVAVVLVTTATFAANRRWTFPRARA